MTARPHRLLEMVFSAPVEVLAGARQVLDGDPSPYDASVAHQAIGIVQREFGDLPGAISHLRRARRLARGSGSPQREADVAATLGVALVQAGRPREGLASLDRAVALSRGQVKARVRFRRAGALRILGRHEAALAEVGLALPGLRRAGDTLWTARAVTLRALLHLTVGATARAESGFAEAERMFATVDHAHDAAVARQNRASVALAAGDLPAALRHLSYADNRFRALGTPMYSLTLDRCAVLLAAGLPDDALREAVAALEALRRHRGQATRMAELLLVAAQAAFDAGDPGQAAGHAHEARRMFGAQQRRWWQHHADLLEVRARCAIGGPTMSLAARAARIAGELTAIGSPEAPQAHVLAARCALALGRRVRASEHLAAASGYRLRGPLQARIGGWLALALRARLDGDVRRLRYACGRGLSLLDEHRLLLGAADLRATATSHGAELSLLAQRSCLDGGDPRDLLTWSERWRSVSLNQPPPRTRDDPVLAAMLASYRDLTGGRHPGEGGLRVGGRLRQLERDIRDRARQRSGRLGPVPTEGFDSGRLLEALGDGRLVQIIEIDGRIHHVVCGRGAVRRFDGGPSNGLLSEVEFARSALRRLARGAAGDPSIVAATARNLESVLLGPVLRHLGDDAVVIVPPARLHGLPWALLPALREREFAVAPSATAWLRARRASPPRNERVTIVRGPGLAAAGEVERLRDLYPQATVLCEGEATVAGVLRAIDGGRMAHIAAHGAVRADNPLFSSLRMDDGPLTVHDVARLRRAPHRLVLPCCESAALTPAGADELLGLAAALLPLGTSAIVACADPVSDKATATLMAAFHTALRAGAATVAEALLLARRAMPDDPVAQATAASFVAIGAG